MPISRILSSDLRHMDSHYSGRCVATKLKRLFLCVNTEDTVLHSGKDLAVSPRLLPNKLIQICIGMPDPFGSRRLCSHLVDYSRWGLPTTCFDFHRISVRTFLPFYRSKKSDHPTQRHIYYIIHGGILSMLWILTILLQ